MKEKKEYKLLKNILAYTAFFTVIVAFLIYIFLKNNKSFIWGEDGLNQHIVTLSYFRELLINFIKTGDFSTFTWNIGNGFNMYGNFAYYIFGDIFSYFSILVPRQYIEYFYSVMVVVRMFFIGVSFLYFCDYKKMNKSASIIGALMYTFCTFALFSAVRHPYFSNALMLFPLVMVGIEKIVKEDKKVFYTLIIALLFLGNFYFAYMISLVIAIYGIILIIYTYRKDGIKKILTKTIQVLIYSVIGVMISAVLLLPTGIEFLNSERSGADKIYPYTKSYYRNIVKNIIECGEGQYWVYTGVQSIILISLPLFLKNRKKDYPIFWTLIILALPLLVSNIGSVFCGFSYPNNRWTFIIAFIFSYITAMFIDDGYKIDKKDFIFILIFILLFITANVILKVKLSIQMITQIIYFILLMIVILFKDKLKNKMIKRTNLYQICFILIFIIGILSTIYIKFEIGKNDKTYVSEFVDTNEFDVKCSTSGGKIEDFDSALEFIKNNDESFYIISKYPLQYENVALIKKYNAKTLYYSIIPNIYSKINKDLENIQNQVNFGYKEFDSRTKINTLLGTKYLIKKGNNNCVPYGYSKIEEYEGKSNIYVNNYVLPFGMLYTSYINEDEYNNLSALEKESSLLKTVALENNTYTEIKHDENAINAIKQNDIKEIEYELIDENNIIKDNKVKIKKLDNNQIKLKIGKVRKSEIYLNIDNTDFYPITKRAKIKSKISSNSSKEKIRKVKRQYRWYQPNYEYKITASFNNKTTTKIVRNYKTSPYYIDDKSMLVNLGYYDETSGEITLTFENIGTYDLSQIKIFAVSMNDYADDIANLKKSNFEVTEYKNGYLKAVANSELDGVLQFATLYNKGWKVYVDGNEVSTFIANKYFLGINITKGEHQIEMKYTTPYLKEGLVISIIGILILGIIIFIENFGKNTMEKRKER